MEDTSHPLDDDDNPYTPGTIYEAEPRRRGMGWIIKLSAAAFLLAIVCIVITQICLKVSLFEPADFEERLIVAKYPAKAAFGFCLLGFALLVLGILFRRKGLEAEEN